MNSTGLKNFLKNATIKIDPTGRFIYKGAETGGLTSNINTQLDTQVNQLLDQLER